MSLDWKHCPPLHCGVNAGLCVMFSLSPGSDDKAMKWHDPKILNSLSSSRFYWAGAWAFSIHYIMYCCNWQAGPGSARVGECVKCEVWNRCTATPQSSQLLWHGRQRGFFHYKKTQKGVEIVQIWSIFSSAKRSSQPLVRCAWKACHSNKGNN
jgi:hypothetical protein